jgi:SNF2 family DNA or RNA helicase
MTCKFLRPQETEFTTDRSSGYLHSLLFIESQLRQTVPDDDLIDQGHRAAMDIMGYQLLPAQKALQMPRQRILIADAVGFGKTLECGILVTELIRQGRGRRILVVTTKPGTLLSLFPSTYQYAIAALQSLESLLPNLNSESSRVACDQPLGIGSV